MSRDTEHLQATTEKLLTTTKLTPPSTTTRMTSPHHHHDNDDAKHSNKHQVSEHERFVRAKTEMEKRHHEKVTKVNRRLPHLDHFTP